MVFCFHASDKIRQEKRTKSKEEKNTTQRDLEIPTPTSDKAEDEIGPCKIETWPEMSGAQ